MDTKITRDNQAVFLTGDASDASSVHGVNTPTIDWPAIERDYRAARLSLRQMSLKHGCSHSAIVNHASRKRWARNASTCG